MNDPFEIQQLLLLRLADGPSVVAKSEGISFELEEFARRTVVAIGDAPPEGSEAVFALPVAANRIAIATAASNENQPPAYRFLFLSAKVYRWIGDPFELAARYPVNANLRGSLPPLAWPDEPRPPRNVRDLQRLLKAGDAPLLLGATQALVDGARLRLVRSRPERELLRNIWQLLPDSHRGDLWPSEWSDGDDLPFHFAARPEAPPKWPPGTIGEEQARDYPEGRYELALQTAVEAGDQPALERVLARRSPRDVLRMALLMVAAAFAAVAAMRFLR